VVLVLSWSCWPFLVHFFEESLDVKEKKNVVGASLFSAWLPQVFYIAVAKKFRFLQDILQKEALDSTWSID
jgi:hypothetical protein